MAPSTELPLLPVILCGGRGTRLWPLSRELYPKQFVEFGEGNTLLGETLERVKRLRGAPSLVICNSDYRFLTAQELVKHGVEGSVVLEPQGRNTAPAAAVAAIMADPGQVLLVLPADHRLEDEEAFARAVELGRRWAEKGRLVCLGVAPRRPETGYGYLHRGRELEPGVHEVEAFVEKPDPQRAGVFAESGEHLWNSGMFLFTAGKFLEALGAYAPDMLAACREAVAGAATDIDFLRLAREPFLACAADSIDYAVMERSTDLCVVELQSPWSDLGSWAAIMESHPMDGDGNVTVGDVFVRGSSGCHLHSRSMLLAAIGVEDITVVEAGDAILVASNHRLHELKDLVDELLVAGRQEVISHPKVYRPWGSFQSIAVGNRFQVKRIIVKPGHTLSLQKHHHRAEHWVVVQGTAKVTNGDREMVLCEDQSTYIPIGNVHRLENPGKIPLEIIEVQTGGYLGEDDIVRLEDVYGREGEKVRG